MYLNAVKYKNHGYIAPGSLAMELYQAKKWSELDKHMAELDKAYKKAGGVSGKVLHGSRQPGDSSTHN